jgi:hypothetical protein
LRRIRSSAVRSRDVPPKSHLDPEFRTVARHAREDHGLTQVSGELVAQVRSNIR